MGLLSVPPIFLRYKITPEFIRNPDYRTAQRLFKAACIIRTKNVDMAAQNVVPVLDHVRKELPWQYYKATELRGNSTP